MDFASVLTKIAEEYSQSPIEFTVELDVQARLTEVLRDEMQSRDALYAEFTNERIRYTGQTANYKESYVDHFLNKVGSVEEPFSRVHTEVAPYEELIEDLEFRERIDVVAFKEQMAHPINWRGGSQRHHWDDYDTAIEVKYVKNKNKFPANINDTNIVDAPFEDLQQSIDLEENSIASDIEELERLPDSTEKYLMVISNHDYLYRGTIEDFDTSRQQRFRRLGDAAVKEMQRRSEQTHILYVHPTGWQWISGNSIQNPKRPAPGDSS